MKEKRDLKIGIKSDKEFFDELKELAGRIDNGWLPESRLNGSISTICLRCSST